MAKNTKQPVAQSAAATPAAGRDWRASRASARKRYAATLAVLTGADSTFGQNSNPSNRATASWRAVTSTGWRVLTADAAMVVACDRAINGTATEAEAEASFSESGASRDKNLPAFTKARDAFKAHGSEAHTPAASKRTGGERGPAYTPAELAEAASRY